MGILESFNCGTCGASFAIDTSDLEDDEALGCPVCGQDVAGEDDSDEDEDDEDDDEE